MREKKDLAVCVIVMYVGVFTHIYAINVEGDVSDGDRILAASELYLQQPIKTPTHEGGIREPRGH